MSADAPEGVAFARLDRGDEMFQSLRRELGVESFGITLPIEREPGEHEGRDGLAWTDWDEEGPGREPREVPLPDDLPV